jgi:hypothetical protein
MSPRTFRLAPVLATLVLAVAGAGLAEAKPAGRNPPKPSPRNVAEPVAPTSLQQIWERFSAWLAS